MHVRMHKCACLTSSHGSWIAGGRGGGREESSRVELKCVDCVSV